MYHPFGAPVPESIAVNVRNRSHTIAADVDLPDAPADGVLLALGCVLGGYSLHVKEGRLRYVHNLYGKESHVIASDHVVGPGAHSLEFAYAPDGDGGGTAARRRRAGGGAGRDPAIHADELQRDGAGLSCGYEVGPGRRRLRGARSGSQACCTVTVTVAVDGDAAVDPVARFDQIMAEQ